ncbi:hypothetical protein LCGC14_1607740 [marine sediment metagenome]|uniref:Uncharacterized protein n=1 Tax=marine sediment metagenome TaxID=412755 RepID=A0A0F9I9N3_9ZZZZ
MKKDVLSDGFIAASNQLKNWQPEATDIQFAPKTCPQCGSTFYITYIVPICLTRVPMDKTLEHCGYFCGGCRLGSHGARKRT